MSISSDIYSLFEIPNIKKEDLRKEIFHLYNISESKNYSYSDSTASQEEEISKWLNNNTIHFISTKKETYIKRSWFQNESDKISYFSQFHCKICSLDGLTIFPIRVNPQTRQVKTVLKNKFQELLQNSPYGQKLRFKPSDRICLKIVFVIKDGRDKDLDNMAKTTLDGLKKLIKVDDKNIDHLELIKIKTKYIEDYIHISICKSDINSDENIILKGANIGWAGLERMELK